MGKMVTGKGNDWNIWLTFMFESCCGNGCQEKSKSVIRSLSLRKLLWWVPCSFSFNQQTFVLCQALSINRIGYTASATGNSLWWCSSNPWRQDSPQFFTSHVCPWWPPYPNTKVGTSAFREELNHLPNCASAAKDTHEGWVAFHHHAWVPHSLQLAPFQCLGRRVLSWPPLLLTAPSPFPFTAHVGSHHTPLHIHSLSKPSSNKLRVQWHFPFSAKTEGHGDCDMF